MGRKPFVLDASVALAWGFEDESSDYTDAVLSALESWEAIVPCIWPLEVGNALLVAERRGRMTQAAVTLFIEYLRSLPITVERTALGRMFGEALALAREQELSLYDASYLDLALRLGLPLATWDRALRKAASRCGVEVFNP
jgi:predicted nucleic acid-binding protein